MGSHKYAKSSLLSQSLVTSFPVSVQRQQSTRNCTVCNKCPRRPLIMTLIPGCDLEYSRGTSGHKLSFYFTLLCYADLGQRTFILIMTYHLINHYCLPLHEPGRVAQSVGHLTRKSGVLGSIPGLATYFRFSFRFFKKGSCQLLAKVCARSTG